MGRDVTWIWRVFYVCMHIGEKLFDVKMPLPSLALPERLMSFLVGWDLQDEVRGEKAAGWMCMGNTALRVVCLGEVLRERPFTMCDSINKLLFQLDQVVRPCFRGAV